MKTRYQDHATRKSGILPDSADGLPACRLRPEDPTGKMPVCRVRLEA